MLTRDAEAILCRQSRLFLRLAEVTDRRAFLYRKTAYGFDGCFPFPVGCFRLSCRISHDAYCIEATYSGRKRRAKTLRRRESFEVSASSDCLSTLGKYQLTGERWKC